MSVHCKILYIASTLYAGYAVMEHIDLVKQEASPTGTRAFLANSDNVAVTIYIPKNLRDTAKKETELRGTTFSSLLR
ncbi:UNVERIFIED_ORG: hypothetical protein QOE_3800 [Clostridioides difficile F501]